MLLTLHRTKQCLKGVVDSWFFDLLYLVYWNTCCLVCPGLSVWSNCGGDVCSRAAVATSCRTWQESGRNKRWSPLHRISSYVVEIEETVEICWNMLEWILTSFTANSVGFRHRVHGCAAQVVRTTPCTNVCWRLAEICKRVWGRNVKFTHFNSDQLPAHKNEIMDYFQTLKRILKEWHSWSLKWI